MTHSKPMNDPWLVALAVGSALLVSGVALWQGLSRRPRAARPSKRSVQPPLAPDPPEPRPETPRRPAESDSPVTDVLRLVVILFGPESSQLSRTAEATLAEAAWRLTDRPELTVTVEGSADTTGNATRNLVLARDRAWAAREYLLARGIAPERIRSVVKTPSAGRTEYERQRLRCVRLTWEA